MTENKASEHILIYGGTILGGLVFGLFIGRGVGAVIGGLSGVVVCLLRFRQGRES